jgi:photosystem II stability/assembly factor-like uncharacterized protein
MGWNTLLNNQCISFNNLQDGCNQLLFINSQPIPVSTEQITKQNFLDYIYTASIPAVLQYPPFVNKTSNQLIVRGDVEVYGGATLVPNYSIVFTGIYYYNFNSLQNIAVGIWSLPAFSNQTTQYYSTFGISDYNWLYIEVDGTSTSPLGFFSVTLSVNGNIISSGSFYYVSGPQSAIVPMPNQYIYAPDDIEITIVDGQTVPINVNFQDQNGGIPIVAVSASRGSGQYQMVATGSAGLGINFLKGSLYRSIDYGATWQASSTNTLYYWQRIAMSDTGQYMIASSLNGPLFLSSNYGSSYIDITSRIRGNATEYFEGTGMSGDGKYIVVCYEEPAGAGFTTKISNNYGAIGSWTTVPGISYTTSPYLERGQSIQGVAISNDGQFIYLSYTDGFTGVVYKSSNSGATWQTVDPGTQYVRDISCSSDGSTVVVTGSVYGYAGGYLSRGYMFKSTNYGVSYTGITNGDYLRNWYRVGQLYTSTSPSGYGTVMTYAGDSSSEVTFPAETYPYNGDTLGAVVNSSLTGMGQRVFTDCAVGGTNGVYRLLGSTTGLFRSSNSGGSWTQL